MRFMTDVSSFPAVAWESSSDHLLTLAWIVILGNIRTLPDLMKSGEELLKTGRTGASLQKVEKTVEAT